MIHTNLDMSYVEMISELMFLMKLQNEHFRQLVGGGLGRFPFVRTGRPDQSVSK